MESSQEYQESSVYEEESAGSGEGESNPGLIVAIVVAVILLVMMVGIGIYVFFFYRKYTLTGCIIFEGKPYKMETSYTYKDKVIEAVGEDDFGKFSITGKCEVDPYSEDIEGNDVSIELVKKYDSGNVFNYKGTLTRKPNIFIGYKQELVYLSSEGDIDIPKDNSLVAAFNSERLPYFKGKWEQNGNPSNTGEFFLEFL